MTAEHSSMTELAAAARVSKAWPFVEAQRLAKRYPDGKTAKDGSAAPVLFETGYGPSGLPHIGTFQEVLRTTLVRRAYEAMIGAKPEDGTTRLVAFSDDMDGLRKVPDNIADADVLKDNLHKPLCRVPDPTGEHESFAHATTRCCATSSTGSVSNTNSSHRATATCPARSTMRCAMCCATTRAFSTSCCRPCARNGARPIRRSCRSARAAAMCCRFRSRWSMRRRASSASPTRTGRLSNRAALGGQAKLQWKVDWAMRWCALGVDYEMYGKDLTDSGVQSGRIAKLLGGRKPEGLIYELFLDANGEKISKSKGNGLTIEQWLEYGTQESLGFYIFPNPKSAKQLHAGVIPRAVDDYWQFRERLAEQPLDKQLGNPVWHLSRANGGFDGAKAPGAGDSLPVRFGLLLNLASVLGAEATEANVADYLDRFYGESARTPEVADLIRAAVNYTRDYIVPTLEKRAPSENEAAALRALDAYLASAPADASAEELQTQVYEIGKDEAFGFDGLRDWFRALYQTLLGSDQGPRMGSFIALYGIDNTRRLIAEALARGEG